MKSWIKMLVCIAVIGSVVSTVAGFPLKLDIDVSAKRTRTQIAAGDEGEAKLERVQVKAKVRKTGGDLPEGKLMAELYVIGKQSQSGNYGIIDVQKGEIELTKDDDYTFTYVSPEYTLGETKGNINVGGTYETYLVVISDAEGSMIDYRCGRAIGDEGVAFIRKLGPKTLFDKDGNIIGELKNPGEAFKQAIPTAAATDDDDDD